MDFSMPDEKLENILTRLKANDKDALKALFDAYYLPVCQSIHRIIREKQTVEDLAQDVFLKVWQKRAQLQVNSSLKAYLCRMGINEAISFLRKHKNKEKEEITEFNTPNLLAQNVEQSYLQNELESKIKEAINSLPPKCRMVFQLSRYEELSYKEIAEKMEISVKTVENQMGKALRVLRERMKGYLKS